MTFCPEDGDPAQVKPRLYIDADRFAAAEGPRFLVEPGAMVTASAGGGADDQIPTLVALLNSPEGLPLLPSNDG
jgi:putative selenate reductase